VFLGIDNRKQGFRLLNLQTRKIFVSRNVTFNETVFPLSKEERQKSLLDKKLQKQSEGEKYSFVETFTIPTDPVSSPPLPEDPVSVLSSPPVSAPSSPVVSAPSSPAVSVPSSPSSPAGIPVSAPVLPPSENHPDPSVCCDVFDEENSTDNRPRSSRVRMPSNQAVRNAAGGDTESCSVAKKPFPRRAKKSSDPMEPSSEKQAMKSDQKDQWRSAMESEIDGHLSQGTYKTVNISSVNSCWYKGSL
jgi:hypothetical protein